MIHVRCSRAPDNSIAELHISVTAESISSFNGMIDRALNSWPDAPQELKELGDILTHGRITQDHTVVKMNTKQNSDYYTPAEQDKIRTLIDTVGQPRWIDMLSSGEAVKEIAKTLRR